MRRVDASLHPLDHRASRSRPRETGYGSRSNADERVPLGPYSNSLGHSTIQTTVDIYSHVAPDHKREMADRVAALYGIGG
jgi:integrase